jgi:predicted ABC-type ATPase
MRPFFYIVAGPNGVGKSMAAFQYLPATVELINSDDIARQIRLTQQHQEVVQRLTNEEAQWRIQQHIRNREPFAVETNLHEADTWQYFTAIQQASGYEFRLLFLCTSELNTLVNRVVNRHIQGGHFVREDVIRGRYVAGLTLLNHFFNVPDTVSLIDASDRLKLIYQRVDGTVTAQANPLPA